MSSPRPILKRHSNPSSSNNVHFSSLTATFSAHSKHVYDRSPIVVTPNSCALPERGCPGRTYALGDPSYPPFVPIPHPYHPPALAASTAHNPRRNTGRVLHPRALLATPAPAYPPPRLIPDFSESDESDSSAYNPISSDPLPYYPHAHTHPADTSLSIPLDKYPYQNQSQPQYPRTTTPYPTTRIPYDHHYTSSETDTDSSYPHSPRPRPRRSPSRSRDHDRTRNETTDSTDPKLRRASRTYPRCNEKGFEDSGCLGGF
jgi:hypothetical protein